MPDSKKDIISKNIVDEIETLDIAGYLKQEVKDFLKHLHYYKIKNILQNIDALKEYLICLDHQNTNQIHELEYEHNKDMEIGDHDVHYYSYFFFSFVGNIIMYIMVSDFHIFVVFVF